MDADPPSIGWAGQSSIDPASIGCRRAVANDCATRVRPSHRCRNRRRAAWSGMQSIAGHGFAAAWRPANGQIGLADLARRGAGGFFFCLSSALPLLWVLVVVALMLAAPLVAFASGEERTTVGDDLVDSHGHALGGRRSRWLSSCASGDRESGSGAVAGARSHALRPGARGDGQAGRWRGSARDRPFHALHSAHGVSTGAASRLRPARRAAIARASHRRRGVVWRRDGACHARGLVQAGRLHGLRHGGRRPAQRESLRRTPATDASALAEVVPPDSLPDSWIDFSGLDFRRHLARRSCGPQAVGAIGGLEMGPLRRKPDCLPGGRDLRGR